jgi:hypothetical protein
MKVDQSYNWIERLFDRIQINYVFTSAIISIILYCIFFIFSKHVKIFRLNDIYYNIEIITMCFLVGYELAGVNYLSKNIRKTFARNISNNDLLSNAYSVLKRRLTKSNWYFLLIALVMVPLLAIDYRLYLSNELPLFSDWSSKTIYLLLDIYNYSLTYFIDFLIGIILWLILNILFIIYEMGEGKFSFATASMSCNYPAELDPLSILIQKIIVYYFICIALAILSYVGPFGFISYQSIYYFILLLIGIIFFFIGSWSLTRIFKKRKNIELNKVNTLYEKKHKRILEILSDEKSERDEDELKKLSTDIDILLKCQDKLAGTKWSAFDLHSVTIFITSFLIPNIALIGKLPNAATTAITHLSPYLHIP